MKTYTHTNTAGCPRFRCPYSHSHNRSHSHSHISNPLSFCCPLYKLLNCAKLPTWLQENILPSTTFIEIYVDTRAAEDQKNRRPGLRPTQNRIHSWAEFTLECSNWIGPGSRALPNEYYTGHLPHFNFRPRNIIIIIPGSLVLTLTANYCPRVIHQSMICSQLRLSFPSISGFSGTALSLARTLSENLTFN